MKRVFIPILTLTGLMAAATLAEAAADTNAPATNAVQTNATAAAVSSAPAPAAKTPASDEPEVNENLKKAMAAAAAAPVAGTNASAALDYRSLVQGVSQLNIFNPRRSKFRTTQPTRTRTPVTRSDWFSLQGTSRNDDVWSAFFSGTSSDYRRTVRAGDSIAGYKITEIANDHVVLLAGGNKTINLPIESQMRRSDGGPWSLGGRSAPSSTDASSSDTPPVPSGVSETISNGGADNDALKRLLAKRLKDE